MTNTPERIYHWLDSQLSIARHYGAIDYKGHRYIVALDEPGQPLVRADVFEREDKEQREKKRSAEAECGVTGRQAVTTAPAQQPAPRTPAPASSAARWACRESVQN